MDTTLIKDSFALVESHGAEVARYFCADLFARDPGLRALFDRHMADQEERLFAALRLLVGSLDDPAALSARLRGLGRRHAGYGAGPEHYPAVGASLLATLERFAGNAWTPRTEAAWAAVCDVAAYEMTRGQEEAGSGTS